MKIWQQTLLYNMCLRKKARGLIAKGNKKLWLCAGIALSSSFKHDRPWIRALRCNFFRIKGGEKEGGALNAKFKPTFGNNFGCFWKIMRIGIFFTCKLSNLGILGSVFREEVEVVADCGQVKMRERVLPSPSSSSPSTIVRLVGDGKLQWECRSVCSCQSLTLRKNSITTVELDILVPQLRWYNGL